MQTDLCNRPGCVSVPKPTNDFLTSPERVLGDVVDMDDLDKFAGQDALEVAPAQVAGTTDGDTSGHGQTSPWLLSARREWNSPTMASMAVSSSSSSGVRRRP